ncbi:unnamed protein product [Arctia plantaginis]|uniref:Uncharacterized protein n=1 Tax=Arctia plantaginis TaxID=874455 RepID=A0A8S1AW11_ARCPL|nr:unnamed protein product [Arctia plantaginis]
MFKNNVLLYFAIETVDTIPDIQPPGNLLGELYVITNELGCVRVAGAWEWRDLGGPSGNTALNKMAEARAPIFEFQFGILEM